MTWRVYKKLFILTSLFFLIRSVDAVVINEFMAANTKTITDGYGDYSDWVELYNPDPAAVDLTGYSLSDDPKQPRKWIFPSFRIDGGEFVLIWCSGRDIKTPPLHTSFKLDKEGEFLGLYKPSGQLLDGLTFAPQQADISYGRFPDGTGEFILMLHPTPDQKNNSATPLQSTASPIFSVSDGRYFSPIVVSLSVPDQNAVIFYTLDGSEPNTAHPLFTSPFTITKTTVVRARAFAPGKSPSAILTRTFLVNENEQFYDLPVLSLTTDPFNLWDPDSGIYANSKEAGEEWERPVLLQYFSEGGRFEISEEAGIRIHGGASRSRSAKKSFRLYFRDEYGSPELEFAIIPSASLTKYRRLVLRAGYNDSWTHWSDKQRRAASYLRDQLVRDLFIALGFPAAHGDFVHLILNGQYWGLYNVTERYDDDFFDTYVTKGPWDVIKPGADEVKNAIEAADGDLIAWKTFEDWFSAADLTKSEAFDQLEGHVCLANLIDFYVINIWLQNTDWPRHNWYATRLRDDSQGRWLFLPWDTEYAFSGGAVAYQFDINMLTKIDEQANYPLGKLLSRLKDNARFRARVVNRFTELNRGVLHPDSLMARISDRSAQVRSAVPFESQRWGQAFAPQFQYQPEDWSAACELMRVFIRKRTDYVKKHFDMTFNNANGGEELTPPSSDLLQNYPNPFRSQTVIRFSLKNAGRVRFSIFDCRGRRVTDWVRHLEQPRSDYELTWDGTTSKGEPVSSGIYLLRMESGAMVFNKKIVVVR